MLAAAIEVCTRCGAGGRGEAKASLFIEKPLATDLIESRTVMNAIKSAKIDAVLGYTQRFRRRFLAVKQKLQDNTKNLENN